METLISPLPVTPNIKAQDWLTKHLVKDAFDISSISTGFEKLDLTTISFEVLVG